VRRRPTAFTEPHQPVSGELTEFLEHAPLVRVECPGEKPSRHLACRDGEQFEELAGLPRLRRDALGDGPALPLEG
jgi:hypothetical protein